jgi:hypothetical protein
MPLLHTSRPNLSNTHGKAWPLGLRCTTGSACSVHTHPNLTLVKQPNPTCGCSCANVGATKLAWQHETTEQRIAPPTLSPTCCCILLPSCTAHVGCAAPAQLTVSILFMSSHPAPGCCPAVTVRVNCPAPPQMQCALHIETHTTQAGQYGCGVLQAAEHLCTLTTQHPATAQPSTPVQLPRHTHQL